MCRKKGGDAKFWQYHAKLFQNQDELGRDNLERWAREIGGIDLAKLRRALDAAEHGPAIEQQQELARSLGATGTPAFFINGRKISGAQPLQAFTTVIDEELRKAQEMVRGGVPRPRLYEAITEEGTTEPQ